MKKLVLLLLLLYTHSLYAQDSLKRNHWAFCEAGLGYSFNPDGPISYLPYESVYIGYSAFTHGIIPSLHLGTFLFAHNHLGIAARFVRPYYFVDKKGMLDFFKSEYPDMSFSTDMDRTYTVSTLQLGPIYSISFKKFDLDVEFLVGSSTLTIPYLELNGVKTVGPNTNGISLYIYRPLQKNHFTTISPSIGLRYKYAERHYMFLRTDASFGFLSGDERINYERYPSKDNSGYNLYSPGDIDNLYLLSLIAGIGINIH